MPAFNRRKELLALTIQRERANGGMHFRVLLHGPAACHCALQRGMTRFLCHPERSEGPSNVQRRRSFAVFAAQDDKVEGVIPSKVEGSPADAGRAR